MKKIQTAGAVALAAALCCSTVHAETLLQVDASAPTAAPTTGHLKLGSSVSPKGERVAVNNQYLSLNGQPWLPVMGEFHYTRSPASSWEAELQKMKAAGIDVVASYVIWNHHELKEGKFDWQGNRDLRRFVQLAAQGGTQGHGAHRSLGACRGAIRRHPGLGGQHHAHAQQRRAVPAPCRTPLCPDGQAAEGPDVEGRRTGHRHPSWRTNTT